MASNIRGHAVIINLREFPGMEKKTRHGSEYDVTRLARLFGQLGFWVDRWDTPEQCTLQVIIMYDIRISKSTKKYLVCLPIWNMEA